MLNRTTPTQSKDIPVPESQDRVPSSCIRSADDQTCVTPGHARETSECDRLPLTEHGMDPKHPPLFWAILYKQRFDAAARHLDELADTLDAALGSAAWREWAPNNPHRNSLRFGIQRLADELARERAEHDITRRRLPTAKVNYRAQDRNTSAVEEGGQY